MSKSNDFKSMSAELDTIIQKLQSGEMDLDDAVKQYEKAVKLVNELETYLKQAENKITQIKANIK